MDSNDYSKSRKNFDDFEKFHSLILKILEPIKSTDQSSSRNKDSWMGVREMLLNISEKSEISHSYRAVFLAEQNLLKDDIRNSTALEMRVSMLHLLLFEKFGIDIKVKVGSAILKIAYQVCAVKDTLGILPIHYAFKLEGNDDLKDPFLISLADSYPDSLLIEARSMTRHPMKVAFESNCSNQVILHLILKCPEMLKMRTNVQNWLPIHHACCVKVDARIITQILQQCPEQHSIATLDGKTPLTLALNSSLKFKENYSLVVAINEFIYQISRPNEKEMDQNSDGNRARASQIMNDKRLHKSVQKNRESDENVKNKIARIKNEISSINLSILTVQDSNKKIVSTLQKRTHEFSELGVDIRNILQEMASKSENYSLPLEQLNFGEKLTKMKDAIKNEIPYKAKQTILKLDKAFNLSEEQEKKKYRDRINHINATYVGRSTHLLTQMKKNIENEKHSIVFASKKAQQKRKEVDDIKIQSDEVKEEVLRMHNQSKKKLQDIISENTSHLLKRLKKRVQNNHELMLTTSLSAKLGTFKRVKKNYNGDYSHNYAASKLADDIREYLFKTEEVIDQLKSLSTERSEKCN